MSELKPYIGPHPTDTALTAYYLKSEADKVIAELEESHKKEVGQLLILNREQANAANRLRDSMERTISHQKCKRCLAMANYWGLVSALVHGEVQLKCMRRELKWNKLAEKFKEAK